MVWKQLHNKLVVIDLSPFLSHDTPSRNIIATSDYLKSELSKRMHKRKEVNLSVYDFFFYFLSFFLSFLQGKTCCTCYFITEFVSFFSSFFSLVLSVTSQFIYPSENFPIYLELLHKRYKIDPLILLKILKNSQFLLATLLKPRSC